MAQLAMIAVNALGKSDRAAVLMEEAANVEKHDPDFAEKLRFHASLMTEDADPNNLCRRVPLNKAADLLTDASEIREKNEDLAGDMCGNALELLGKYYPDNKAIAAILSRRLPPGSTRETFWNSIAVIALLLRDVVLI